MANRFGIATNPTVVETFDAAGVSGLAKHLPNDNGRHRYRLRDPSSAASCTEPLCRHVLRAAGDLQVSWVEEQLGTRVQILEPGIAAHCFSTVRSGSMQLSLPSVRDGAQGGPDRGLIHQGQSGTAALTMDGTARTNLWVSSALIESALAAAVGETPQKPVVFRPVIDWASGAGPSVQRLLSHVAAEFGQPDGLATQALALAGFTDLFIHTALSRLPHNYTDHLARMSADASPRHLRRAEAFMHAAACQPIRLADIAEASGCSVRSLQNAFRSFRDTTPHNALQRIRLELAQADLLRGDDAVATVARRYGFSNAGRFSALYARSFGNRPRTRR